MAVTVTLRSLTSADTASEDVTVDAGTAWQVSTQGSLDITGGGEQIVATFAANAWLYIKAAP